MGKDNLVITLRKTTLSNEWHEEEERTQRKCRIETWELDIFIKEKKWKLPVLEDAVD